MSWPGQDEDSGALPEQADFKLLDATKIERIYRLGLVGEQYDAALRRQHTPHFCNDASVQYSVGWLLY